MMLSMVQSNAGNDRFLNRTKPSRRSLIGSQRMSSNEKSNMAEDRGALALSCVAIGSSLPLHPTVLDR